MPGIEEDIQRTEAAGFVHTGFRGGAVEYQNYTCPRTGLILCIPLSNGPYIVQRSHPDYTELGRTPLIDDAFALIAEQPTVSAVPMPQRRTPQAEAEYVAMRAREAAQRLSRPAFPALPPGPGRAAASAKPPRSAPPAGNSGGVSRSRSGRASGTRAATAQTSTQPTEEEDPPWLRWTLRVLIGIPGLMLLVWLVVSNLLPALMLPAMYVMGLGKWTVLLAGAVAGVTWAVAASTWFRPRNAGAVLGGAAFGALSSWLLAAPDELLGRALPIYGAMAVASLVSAVLEHPLIHRGRMAVLAAIAGPAGALLAAESVDPTPLPALWLTAVAVHGIIALASRRIWQGLLAGESVGSGQA